MDEKQLWDKYGTIQKNELFPIGPYYSYQLRNSRRHILFTLSRYKFALKMIGERKKVLELGCNEGLGTYYLAEFATNVKGVDFDEVAIDWAKKNLPNENLSFEMDNFLGKIYGEFDAVVSYDVIEHIYAQNEVRYFETIVKNLNQTGVCLVGTPNIESERFANPEISGAHINLFSGKRLQETLENYFHNVFLFSQNDEMIHTGYSPMAHYLICLCCNKK